MTRLSDHLQTVAVIPMPPSISTGLKSLLPHCPPPPPPPTTWNRCYLSDALFDQLETAATRFPTSLRLLLPLMTPFSDQLETAATPNNPLFDQFETVTTLLENGQLGTLFCPVFITLGGGGGGKGSLHVQEPKKVSYITKNYSKDPKPVLKRL